MPDGEPFPVDLTIVRTKWDDKHVGLGYIYDMREQNRLKTEIEAALIKTKEASRAKSEFLSRISHEMRTPMNALMGMTQIAQRSSDLQKTLTYLNKIGEYSSKLLQLIDNMLDITRMEYNTFQLASSVFDFNAMMQEIIQMTSYYATWKNLTFTHDVSPSIPASLLGDEGRLKQVIISLLGNSIKFTPENGKINLSVFILCGESDNLTLQFEIGDTGIGIIKEKHDDIFNIFEQADGGPSRKHGGIGLGLPLSKRIIEMMGGTIYFESNPEIGTKFIFSCNMLIPKANFQAMDSYPFF
jgi:signal transduction histidine kinase